MITYRCDGCGRDMRQEDANDNLEEYRAVTENPSAFPQHHFCRMCLPHAREFWKEALPKFSSTLWEENFRRTSNFCKEFFKGKKLSVASGP